MVKIPSNADSMHCLMPKGKNLGHACLAADQEVMKGSALSCGLLLSSSYAGRLPPQKTNSEFFNQIWHVYWLMY